MIWICRILAEIRYTLLYSFAEALVFARSDPAEKHDVSSPYSGGGNHADQAQPRRNGEAYLCFDPSEHYGTSRRIDPISPARNWPPRSEDRGPYGRTIIQPDQEAGPRMIRGPLSAGF